MTRLRITGSCCKEVTFSGLKSVSLSKIFFHLFTNNQLYDYDEPNQSRINSYKCTKTKAYIYIEF